jgi:hypothetical protein
MQYCYLEDFDMKGKLKRSTAPYLTEQRTKKMTMSRQSRKYKVLKSIWRPKVKGCYTTHFNY